ncbi:MAG TPA: hypothetical protein VN281_20495 [Verrucomicrobiae bacterium]|nr:hypothetical protein [Verrucomicrobiae bacterium]
MKKIFLALIGIGLCLQSRGEGLSTTDGTTYNNITSKRADPDGLYIEYSLPGGGLGMSKVKFSRLSPDQQKQYGYDEARAREYEAKVAQAQEDFRQECIRSDQIARAEKLARKGTDYEQARIENDRLMALAQLKAAEAEMSNANGGGYGYGNNVSYPYGYDLPRSAYILGARNAARPQSNYRQPRTNPAFSTEKRLGNRLGLQN